MGDEKQPKTKLSVFFKEAIWTFILVLILELFEEVLEEAIAVGFVWLIQKTVSVILVVTLTQTAKLLLKRIIKMITYKEGKDKMKILKNMFTFLWHNKLTTFEIGVSAFAGYCAYLMNFFEPLWANLGLAISVGFLGSIVAVRIGGETLKQIVERLAKAKLTKEQLATAKAEAKKAEELANKIKGIYEDLAMKEILARENVLMEKAKLMASDTQNNQEKEAV